jgi:hypothetical protein
MPRKAFGGLGITRFRIRHRRLAMEWNPLDPNPTRQIQNIRHARALCHEQTGAGDEYGVMKLMRTRAN